MAARRDPDDRRGRGLQKQARRTQCGVLGEAPPPPPWRSWEDVVNVPPRATVRIAWLPDDRPGSWMYNCHILEHHASGMMGHFDVVP